MLMVPSSYSDMHLPCESVQIRCLSSMRECHDNFMRYCNGDIKHASLYYNCLHAPILNIEIDKVAPPYLHILLGIVQKHHTLLEEAADRIDTKIMENIQT